MPQQNWVAPANANAAQSGVAGTTLSTAATLAISPSSTTAPDYSLPGGVAYPGMMIRCTASGIYTTGSTATNATFAIMFGGTGGTIMATSGAIAMLVSQTHVSWWLEALLTCRSSGSAATWWTSGYVAGIVATAPMSVSRLDSGGTFGTPATASISSVSAAAIVLNGTLSQVVGSPTITCEQWLVELVG